METAKIINTAVLKTMKTDQDTQLELEKYVNSEVTESIGVAIEYLSERKDITKDSAAELLVEYFSELNSLWKNQMVITGIDAVKKEMNY